MPNPASLLVRTADGRVNPGDHTFVPPLEELELLHLDPKPICQGTLSLKALPDVLFTRIALPP